MLEVSIWRLRYAIESRYLPPPAVVLKRRALFSPDQIEAMRVYFQKDDAHRRKCAGTAKDKDEVGI